MPPQLPNESEAIALRKEANLAYLVHDRLSPVLRVLSQLGSASERRANFASAEVLESFLWLHLGLRVGYFPGDLSRRLVYEHFHLFLRAYERILDADLMESWFTPPLRSVWASEFTGRQELFSFGEKWDGDSAIGQELSSVFQSLFMLANGFAQNSMLRELLLAMVIATDSQWEEAVQSNRPFESVEEVNPEVGSEAEILHWAYPGFFELVDYMRAFRRVEADARQMLERSHPSNFYIEAHQYIYLLKQAQLWRLNFGDAEYRGRFLRVARMAAETLAQRIEGEKGDSVQRAGEEFVKELYPLMTDWGAPQAASA